MQIVLRDYTDSCSLKQCKICSILTETSVKLLTK